MERPSTQRTILVVEDEFLIRTSAVAMLEDAGFWVLEAQNSFDAREMMRSHSEISILVTDVRMPGLMNGLELVARTRLDYPAIRSIVVSGTTSADEASDAGALGFVPKPYMAQAMVQAVRDTMLRNW